MQHAAATLNDVATACMGSYTMWCRSSGSGFEEWAQKYRFWGLGRVAEGPCSYMVYSPL